MTDDARHNLDLAANVDDLLARVAAAAHVAGRRAEDVTVVAVSKMVNRTAVDAAVALGLRHFGENRVQDANRKFAEPLPDGTHLHLIGQLQSNKAKPAVALFNVIESVDRSSLIEALENAAVRRGEPLPVLLQVNIAHETQKGGCDPDEAARLMAQLVRSPALLPMGLMTIAPFVDDAEEVRPIFAGLRTLRDELQRRHPDVDLSRLSMGMSNDFAVAVAEGATWIRIGRAIFGE
ncbi:MAG: YggS family pyridoxal phosphate-dependent enzyme [Chloroflexia bacterium]|nr:YggS family pyridoxal phosphate-dependent enzyme [Chloroflexia bacterium]